MPACGPTARGPRRIAEARFSLSKPHHYATPSLVPHGRQPRIVAVGWHIRCSHDPAVAFSECAVSKEVSMSTIMAMFSLLLAMALAVGPLAVGIANAHGS